MLRATAVSTHVHDVLTQGFKAWPGSKVCSEHMNDWQYLSPGDLEQNEFSPKVNLEVFLCLNV